MCKYNVTFIDKVVINQNFKYYMFLKIVENYEKTMVPIYSNIGEHNLYTQREWSVHSNLLRILRESTI